MSVFEDSIVSPEIIGNYLFSTTSGSKNLEDDGISLVDAFAEDGCDEMIEAEEESGDKPEDHTDEDENTVSMLPFPSLSSCANFAHSLL